jgi:hypothetical protein
MRTRGSGKAAACGAIALLVLIAGCSSGSATVGHSDAGGSTGGSTSGSMGAATGPPSRSSSAGIAQNLTSLTLQPDDLPEYWVVAPGWTAGPQPTATGAADDAGTPAATLYSCLGLPDPLPQLVAAVLSPQYVVQGSPQDADGSQRGESTVEQFGTAAAERTWAAKLASPTLATCWAADVMATGSDMLPDDAVIASADVTAIPPRPGDPPAYAGTIRATLQVQAAGAVVRELIDYALLSAGTIGVELSFAGVGQPVPDEVEAAAIAAVAGRLAAF